MSKKKKNQINPFELQPELNRSRKAEKIPAPLILSLGLIVSWVAFKTTCIVNYVQTQDKELFDYLNLSNIFYNPEIPIVLDQKTIIVSLIAGAIAVMMCIVSNDKKQKTRTGAEHGSAQFASKEASLPFRDPDIFYNTIFSENELFSINDSISKRNRNVLMLGSPGVGKSRFVYKPNLLNKTRDESIFVSDPKGELLESCGYALKQAGYEIKVLDLAEPNKSDHFNIFEYIPFKNKKTGIIKRHLTDEEFESREWTPESAEVMTLIDGIMKNTNAGEAKPNADPFWDNCTQLELSALFFYVLCNCPLHKQNFGELMNLSRKADCSKKGIDNPLTKLFNEWELGQYYTNQETGRPIKATMPLYAMLTDEEKEQFTVDAEGYVHKKEWVNEYGVRMAPDKNAFGVKQWKSLIVGAGSEKTMATVLLCLQSRLNLIDVPEMNNLLSNDEMKLDDIGFKGKGRKAYFIVSSPSRQAFMWFGALFYTLAFQLLEDNAKKQPGKRNEIPINFYLDELANIGTIPNLIQQMTLVRGYNAGVFAGLQSLTQLKNMYDKEWEVFMDACNYILFLGSQSSETLKYISEMLGKETIITKSGSTSYGKSKSNSGSWQTSQRDLLTIDELRSMPKGCCILLDGGVKVEEGTAYFSKLYELKNHPRSYLLYDGAPTTTLTPEEKAMLTEEEKVVLKYGQNFYDHSKYQKRERDEMKYLKACGVDTTKIQETGVLDPVPFDEFLKIDPSMILDADELKNDPEIAKKLNEMKMKLMSQQTH